MEIVDLDLDGPMFFVPKAHHDTRGTFREIYNINSYSHHMPVMEWKQSNHSTTKQDGLRGLHYRDGEVKLVTVIHGCILDVVVDIRPKSKTFGRWVSVKLFEGSQIFVPDGFAHGFVSIASYDSKVVYLTNKTYDPAESRALAWNDSDLNIYWGVENPIISKQDQANSSWRSYVQSLDSRV